MSRFESADQKSSTVPLAQTEAIGYNGAKKKAIEKTMEKTMGDSKVSAKHLDSPPKVVYTHHTPLILGLCAVRGLLLVMGV